MRAIWVGSTAPQISRLTDGALAVAGEAATPAFLAAHPVLPRLYAVQERSPGSVAAFAVDGARLVHRATVTSGGQGPCHLTVHPEGGWLYAANYSDGVLAALELDAEGDLTGEVVTFPHAGHGPNSARQEGPHAHSSWVSPGGSWLVVADLGTDELRSYRLVDGRPDGEPVLSAVPPGSGPRHAAVAGDLIHVACELSCDVLSLRWDEAGGTAQVVAAVGAVTLPARSGDEHYLSHLELLDGRTLVVGVRGADSLAVIGLDADGVVDRLLAEVPTVTWPRHLTVADGAVLVAGERADAIGVHAIDTAGDSAVVGELAQTIPTPAPMCLLPVR